ncbi:hypothetical protein NFI95_07905 [Acetobacteraceae bacterium KSS8]|uniref:DHH family phosphoesterase n=1 Tax=Endosaccharibacter trunci TaxID=2812733 RepID=A0ABT1W664_9PROT|nr:hypothetical protein [Acetobacteraceae bacterium KSS8]
MNETEIGRAFAASVAAFPPGETLILSHDDADGLSSGAILARALRRSGRTVRSRLVGRGENAWSEAMRQELEQDAPASLIVSDLGLRAQVLCAGTPTVVIDHHVTDLGCGTVAEAVLGLTGYGMADVPTSSLLALWCARGLADAGMIDAADDLLWLAAIGLIGDLGDGGSVFPEFQAAKKAYGITALRKAVSLLNAPRRSANGDGGPALALLEKADGPKAVLSGAHAETESLLAAKREVAEAMEAARKLPPVVGAELAVIRLHSACQIHPLVAQSWRGRLKDRIVMAANTGFRPGWVHFAARTQMDIDLVAFFRAHAPEGADEHYGNGHKQASGGALPIPVWNRFIRDLGFGPALIVNDMKAAA